MRPRLWRYPRCVHRSHRLRLPCLRYQIWDWLCQHHNNTCHEDHRWEDRGLWRRG